MAIFRGTGSASTTSDQATIDAVTDKAAEAATSASNAASSASSASTSASSASSSASSASTSASTATTKASEASASASDANDSANAAATSESNAASSETAAGLSASQALASANNSSASKVLAETAQAAAEAAVVDAETALASTQAVLVSTQAVYDDFDDRYLGAKASDPTVDNDGDALIDGALYFDTTNAQMKVYDLSGTSWEAFSLTAAQLTDVDIVATNIADVQSVADNIADIQAAQTSATNASNSADAASTSASQASGFASNASDSATAAASSAASAATALDSFDDRYLGAKSSAPTTDNDGDALVTGALYYDTTEGSMYVYEGSSWIKASASIVDTWDEFVFTATNAQTAFTGADDNTNTLVTSDYMIVTRNGVRLTEGVGYTVTTGTVTLATGAATGDIITITVFASLQVADTLSLSQGGTVTGAVTFNGNVDGIAFSEIDSTPTTLAGYGITDAATSAQGALADSATQPGDLATVATTGAYSDLTGSPTAVSSFTNDSGYITGYTVTQGDVTAHQAALSITESQISDLQSYLTSIPDNYILNTGDAITGDLTFGDNVSAVFGAGSDFKIFHNGDNTYMNDLGTGNLYISTNGAEVSLRKVSGNEAMLIAKPDAEVELYYDDSLKLETTNTGVDVTGTVTADGVSLGDNEKAQFGASNDLEIYHDGTNSYISDAGSGSIHLRSDSEFRVQNAGGTANYIYASNGGLVRLYHNNSGKLDTTATGVSVTGDLTASGNVTAYSDERLKSDIATIDNALDKVSAMRGVTYTKDGELSSGVIAQELQQVAPELVIDGEYLSVAYGNLVGYLIEAVKELKAEVEELKGAK